MKQVIGVLIALAFAALMVFVLMSNHWMMTTWAFRDDLKISIILNEATKELSEYKHYDFTYTKEEVEGDKVTNIISTRFKLSVGENGAYNLYAEKTLPVAEGEPVVEKYYYSVKAGETKATVNIEKGEQDFHANEKTLNEAIMYATATDISSFAKAQETAYVKDIAFLITNGSFTEESVKDYNASLIFSVIPFSMGVDYTKHTVENEETREFNQVQYSIGFNGNVMKKTIKDGVEKQGETRDIITYHSAGGVVEVPAFVGSQDIG